MPKSKLLLVDRDAQSLRVLQVSLEQAGFDVAAASSGSAALAGLEQAAPDLVITSTDLPEIDGYGLVRRMRDQSRWSKTPVIFLTDKLSIEDKIRGLELGVEEYLSKPVFVRELLSRVGLALARLVRDSITEGLAKKKGRVEGTLADVAVYDLLDVLERSSATGCLRVFDGRRRGELLFQAGSVIDASFERLRGEEAVFRALVWPRGRFEFVYGTVDSPTVIERGTRALLEAGLGHLAEWNRLLAALPTMTTTLSVDVPELSGRMGQIPDELNGVLQLLDGSRSLYDILDESPFDDLSTLLTISKLHGEGLLLTGEERIEAAPASHLPVSPADTPEGEKRDTHPWLESDDEGTSKAVVAERGAAAEAEGKQKAEGAPAAAARTDEEITLDRDQDAEPELPEEDTADHDADAPEAAAAPEPAEPPPGPEQAGSSTTEEPEPDFDDSSANLAVDALVAAGERAEEDGAAPPAEGRVIVTPSMQRELPKVLQDGLEQAVAAIGPDSTPEAEPPTEAAPPAKPTEDAPVDEPAPTPDSGPPPEPPVRPPEDAPSEPPAAADDDEAPPSSQDKPSEEPPASEGEGPQPAPSSQGERRKPPKPPPRRKTPRPEPSADELGDGDEDEEDDDALTKALSESGVSEGFFQSMPTPEPEEEEPPYSEQEPVYLTAEQLARRNRMMKIVGGVIGVALAIMLFILLRGQKPDGTTKSGLAGSQPVASTDQSGGAAEPGSGGTLEPGTLGGGGASPEDAGTGGEAPDAEPEDAGELAADAEGDEPLPEVENPLQQARTMLNSGRYKDAIPFAKAAIKADPDDAEAYQYLAEAYRALGQGGKMQETYDECVRRATKNVTSRCPYGRKP